MRLLIDECLPRALKRLLQEHTCRTAQEMGWSGKKNGEHNLALCFTALIAPRDTRRRRVERYTGRSKNSSESGMHGRLARVLQVQWMVRLLLELLLVGFRRHSGLPCRRALAADRSGDRAGDLQCHLQCLAPAADSQRRSGLSRLISPPFDSQAALADNSTVASHGGLYVHCYNAAPPRVFEEDGRRWRSPCHRVLFAGKV